MAKAAPAFQFYAQDFYMGTSDLSAAARGCYISMICMSWTAGPIADNLNSIAKAMSWGPMDPPFADLWAEIKGKWTLGPDGWTNDRLEAIRAAQEANRQKQSERGKAGGKASAQARAEAETQAQVDFQPQPQVEIQPQPAVGLEPKPEASSSIFDLRSSSSSSSSLSTLRASARQQYGPPLMGGPLEHRSHGWCNDRGLCLPAGLYAELLARLPSHRKDEFRPWLESVVDGLGDNAPGDNVFDFWRNHFGAWVGTVTTKPLTGKDTQGNRLAKVGADYIQGEIARRKERELAAPRPLRQIAEAE